MDRPRIAQTLRVMTYNVHACVGGDGQRSETRIARVIAETNADIAGLQELDLGRRRSAGVDQAGIIAEHLGWYAYFHPAIRQEDEQYGDAILSRFPLSLRQAKELPAAASFLCRESRSAIWAEVSTPSGALHVINTHLGLGWRERLTQTRLLSGVDWLRSVPPDQPLVMLGDFNSLPHSRALRLLEAHLCNVTRATRERFGRATYPARFPLLALDHIFINQRLTANGAFVHHSPVARIASDHLPLIADVSLVQNETDEKLGKHAFGK